MKPVRNQNRKGKINRNARWKSISKKAIAQRRHTSPKRRGNQAGENGGEEPPPDGKPSDNNRKFL